ncbi:MAG: VPLPA-CTERM-specific exosortase XrtD [Gammaproteobacteria bacterium]|nr:VPLPA-CTERM-specific exosortase XrtD [Gammaproteobacteria bacterium]
MPTTHTAVSNSKNRNLFILVTLVAITCLGLGLVFYNGLQPMFNAWFNKEEYSHGVLIPVISAYLVWLKKEELASLPFSGSWLGVIITLAGLFLFLMGELSTLYILVQYAFLLTLYGLVFAFIGWRGVKIIWVALVFLLFMIPLPNFLYNNISAALQLISSELGVAVIRFCNISVYLQGNVIDLGDYKLQVVEACNGLRYLFPLMSLAFLCAYLFKAPLWQKALIFLSSIPLTILMNSFRIGVIGVLVEYWGVGMAEGFLHDFEGWLVFMACMAVLLAEIALLARFTGAKRSFSEAFGIFTSPTLNEGATQLHASKPFIVSVAVLLIVAVLVPNIQTRAELPPERQEFSYFPMNLAQWQGQRTTMEQQFIDALKFDDYILANYEIPDQVPPVNLYVAYYDSQRKGESAHSPRSCIPGDGWQMKGFSQRAIEDAQVDGKTLRVNRVEIQKGENRQLVYYWFQQRGRVITNEYLVKWYLFWDALTQNRTDGAMVRLTTYIDEDRDIKEAEASLAEFARLVVTQLNAYVPSAHVVNDI